MILTDLLDRPVHGPDGARVGYVIDVRFALDGPPGQLLAGARLHGLLVSPRTRTPLLGYERTAVRSPWPIAQILRRRHRGTFMVRWEDVQKADVDALHLRAGFRRWSAAMP